MEATKKRKLKSSPQTSSQVAFKKPKHSSPPAETQTSPKESPAPEPEAAIETIEASPKSFQELGIIDSLCDACTALGYKKPTPIQNEAIPLALQGRDLIGLAETGSGKTAAFALPILQALMDKPQPLFGLVMAPTRELAYQISQAFEALGSLISVRTAVIVGGFDMVPQAIALGKKPHIIVATPGRLLDHLENTKGFSLRSLKYLVMDEADRLLDLDFGAIIDKILKVLPRERKTYLFSATMTSKVESLQRASLSNPLRVSISTNKYQTVSTLLQSYVFFPHSTTPPSLDHYYLQTLTHRRNERPLPSLPNERIRRPIRHCLHPHRKRNPTSRRSPSLPRFRCHPPPRPALPVRPPRRPRKIPRPLARHTGRNRRSSSRP